MPDSQISGRKFGMPLLFGSLILIALVAGLVLVKPFAAYDPNAHSLRENLSEFEATDVCEMLPMRQFGKPFDKAGKRVAPIMTVYMRAPEDRRPETGDVLEIVYPKFLEGRVRFNQITNNGYGGSGSLKWVDVKHEPELALAVWDMTISGSLQYRNGKTLLRGDCKKSGEL